ncbi:MAG TPA: FAD-dependent oxidoreductase [Bacteroidetes bacterium]|nr:FAD-dependent oxidoreductase [Bacteroidota bacterium]
MKTWYDSRVIKIEEQTPTTKRFWVEVEGVDSFAFKAGQFVTMDLPIGERRRQRWRSYSIANAPDGTKVLEFCIVRLEGGAGTTYFFEEVGTGTPIRFKGPAGSFVLPEKIEQELVFICTGTGVAPFRSMIHDLHNRGEDGHSIHLIFGTRFNENILYQKEFAELAEKMPGFRYDICLSRESELLPCLPSGLSFGLRKGYVHPVYLEQYKEVKPGRLFYLCGWKEMIDEAVANLTKKLGYDRKQVKYELYG